MAQGETLPSWGALASLVRDAQLVETRAVSWEARLFCFLGPFRFEDFACELFNWNS
jgi:hypothetical protein